MSKPTEALGDAAYRAETPEFRRGYDRGWDDAYVEMGMDDWRATPPLFRRFFWHPRESFDVTLLKLHLFDLSEDEHCNPLVNLRLRNGVLSIRYGRRVRNPQEGRCLTCRAEEKEWEESRDAR